MGDCRYDIVIHILKKLNKYAGTRHAGERELYNPLKELAFIEKQIRRLIEMEKNAREILLHDPPEM